MNFTSRILYPHHIQRVQVLRHVVPDLQHISAVSLWNSIGFWNTFPWLMRTNSRKTGQPTVPTYIYECGPQESWPLHCKQPPTLSFDEYAMCSYRQPTNWNSPPAGTFNSWPLPSLITKISLSFIARGRSQLYLIRIPYVTLQCQVNVFQQQRQFSLKYLSCHLWHLISAFFYTHSTIFVNTRSVHNTIWPTILIHTHIKHKDRLRNFLLRQ